MKLSINELRKIIRNIIKESTEQNSHTTHIKNFINYYLNIWPDTDEFENIFNILKDKLNHILPADIKSDLGRGKFGQAYELENGMVLKLYTREAGTPGSDAKWYESQMENLHSGKGSIRNLYVFDVGKIDISYLRKTFNISYALMPKLQPLPDFIQRTRGELKKTPLHMKTSIIPTNNKEFIIDQQLFKFLNLMLGNKNPSKDEFIKAAKLSKINVPESIRPYQEYLQEEIDSGGFTVNEILSLRKTFISFFKTKPGTIDIHKGNIGLLPNSDPANPVFVIFDK